MDLALINFILAWILTFDIIRNYVTIAPIKQDEEDCLAPILQVENVCLFWSRVTNISLV